MRLKPYIGPKRYVFKDPDTGFKYVAKDRSNLIRQIISYRANNNLEPLESINAVIDNYLCSLPENKGLCEANPTLHRGLLRYIQGGVILLKNVLYKKFVHPNEADRRAKICIKCPYNEFPNKDIFVKWSDDLAKAAIGDKRSLHYNELGNCSVCTCPLRVKVWYTGDIELEKAEYDKMVAVKCWQTEKSEYLKIIVDD